MLRSTNDSLPPRALLALLLVFSLIWFGSLHQRKLIKPDEGRYAEIAREMAVSGDFVTPRLNGIKYFEKPPLQYWATAAAFTVFGPSEWAARLWGALTGFASVLLAWFTARALWGPRVGLLAGAVLGSSLLPVTIGHMNTLDMGLTFFLQLALSGILLANRENVADKVRRGWMLVTWGALALAVLSKGIVALVLGGTTLVAYSLLCRDLRPWRRLYLLSGLVLFLAITVPWFVAVSLVNPEFPHFFFIHEHFERFLTKTHGRYQPAWYFIPILLLGALPWTLPTLQSLVTSWRREKAGVFRPAALLTVWIFVVFAFFSASGSKLPSYILPLFPASALLCAGWLAVADGKTQRAHFAVIAAVALIALALVSRVSGLGDRETPAPMMAAYTTWLVIAACLFLGAALAACWLAHRGRTLAAPLLLAFGGLAASTGILLGHESLSRSNSSYYVARELRPLLAPGVAFYSVAMYDQTLPFYLERTVTLVDYRDEMGFGLDQEPQLAVPTIAEFSTRWRTHQDAFAVMQPDIYDQLTAMQLPMQIVLRDTRRVFVRKPAS